MIFSYSVPHEVALWHLLVYESRGETYNSQDWAHILIITQTHEENYAQTPAQVRDNLGSKA